MDQKWEYLINDSSTTWALQKDALKTSGECGWELVGIIMMPHSVHPTFYFKRLVRSEGKQ